MNNEESQQKQPTRSHRLREASLKRRNAEKQEVRQAILQASSELFLQHGYENFSLRQVAERIGYSPGTIYLYFESKDDVLFTIMEEGVTRFSGMLTEASGVVDVRERLYRLGQAYVDFGRKYPAHYQLMFMQRPDFLERRSSPDATAAHAPPQPLLAIFELWRSTVEEAMQAGVLRPGDPVSTGDTLWALLHGVVSIAILMPRFDEARIQEMTRTALEMMTNGLHGT